MNRESFIFLVTLLCILTFEATFSISLGQNIDYSFVGSTFLQNIIPHAILSVDPGIAPGVSSLLKCTHVSP